MYGSGFRVEGLWFRIEGSGFRVLGFGLRHWNFVMKRFSALGRAVFFYISIPQQLGPPQYQLRRPPPRRELWPTRNSPQKVPQCPSIQEKLRNFLNGKEADVGPRCQNNPKP